MLETLLEELEGSSTIADAPDPLMALATAFGVIASLAVVVIVRWQADVRRRGRGEN